MVAQKFGRFKTNLKIELFYFKFIFGAFFYKELFIKLS